MLQVLLPLLREQVAKVVRGTTPATAALTQRAVAGVLRLCTRLLMYRSDVTDELVDCLKVRRLHPHRPTAGQLPPCSRRPVLRAVSYARLDAHTNSRGQQSACRPAVSVHFGRIAGIAPLSSSRNVSRPCTRQQSRRTCVSS